MPTQLQIRRGSSAENDAFTGASGELTFDTTNNRVRVHDGATQGGYELKTETSGGDTLFADNEKAIFGTGSDLQIYHDGSNSFIEDSGTGNLKVIAQDFILNSQTPANMITAYQNAAVSLFYSGAAKLATTSTGIDVTGNATFDDNGKAIFGAGSDLQIYHNGSHSIIEDFGTGAIKIKVGDFRVENASGNNLIKGVGDVATLHHAGSEKLASSATGIDVTGTITADGLTVDGDAVFTTGDTIRLNTSDGSDNGTLAITAGGANSDARGAKLRLYGNEHASLAGIVDLAAGNVAGGHIYNYTNAKLRQKIDYNGDVNFYATNGTTQAFHWDAADESLGIGTTSPSAPLQVAYAPSDTVGDVGISLKDKDNAIEFGFRLDAASKDLHLDRYYGGAWDKTMSFDRSSGNVGIGTSSPATLLHLESDTPVITLRDTSAYSAGTGPYIQFQGLDSGSTNRVFSQIYGLSNGSNSGELAFYTRNSGLTAERMRIDSSGNVGIGVTPATSYGNVLQIHDTGTSGANLRLTDNTSGSATGNGFEIIQIGVNNYTINRENGFIATYTNGSEAMRISSDGSCRWTPDGTNPDMTLDASGNLLVGTTTLDIANNGSNTGFVVNNNGTVEVGSSSTVLTLNKYNDDDIIRFQKNGAEVGSIGVEGGDLVIGTGTNCGLQFNDGNAAIRPFNIASNAAVDNAVDLGVSGSRFKDLHLSGGVVLDDNPTAVGGDVTSKTLDDYEEGTWTPTLNFGGNATGMVFHTQSGSYVKIGQVVTAQFRIELSSKGSSTGGANFGGIPFNATSVGTLYPAFFGLHHDVNSGSGNTTANVLPIGQIARGTSSWNYYQADSVTQVTDAYFNNDSVINGTVTFRVT